MLLRQAARTLRAQAARAPGTPLFASNPGPQAHARQFINASALPAQAEAPGHARDYGKTPDAVMGRIVSPVTNELWARRQEMKAKMEGPNAAILTPQTKLIPKPPTEQSMVYAFTSNPELVEEYKNPWGFVRMGRLLEDLDSLAGNIAYGHCDDNDATTRPLLIVTAGVDRIALDHPLNFESDMVLAGKVVYTGRTSMEIRMTITNAEGCALRAHFHFVARDPTTGKGAPVNPVAPAAPEDVELYERAKKRAEVKKAQRAAGEAPDVAEAREKWKEGVLAEAMLHRDMPALAPGDSMLLRSTRQEHNLICQPQSRNMHGRIFGGFLMRRAFEIAFTTAYTHAGSRPSFLQVGDISFQRAVDVGDLLCITADVLSADRDETTTLASSTTKGEYNVIHVQVIATVRKPETRTSFTTNTLDFSFATEAMSKDGERLPLKRIIPDTPFAADRIWRALNKVKGTYLPF